MDTDIRPSTTSRARVISIGDGLATTDAVDDLATEEPLEIRLVAGAEMRSAAITMRTPGNDFELAAGFLYNEGNVASAERVRRISYCLDPSLGVEQRYNIVNVELAGKDLPDLAALERHFTMTSACGVCGKASLEGLLRRGVTPIVDEVRVDKKTLLALPERMREAQRVFASTGGLHAAALFDERGTLLALREDVGRHNALDKLVGWGLLNGKLPFLRSVALVSGRASYELVQKCASARIAVMCAVSAPSSLAVQTARAFDVTLVGFLRAGRCNVYHGIERITGSDTL